MDVNVLGRWEIQITNGKKVIFPNEWKKIYAIKYI
jgi:hypothetical protein